MFALKKPNQVDKTELLHISYVIKVHIHKTLCSLIHIFISKSGKDKPLNYSTFGCPVISGFSNPRADPVQGYNQDF